MFGPTIGCGGVCALVCVCVYVKCSLKVILIQGTDRETSTYCLFDRGKSRECNESTSKVKTRRKERMGGVYFSPSVSEDIRQSKLFTTLLIVDGLVIYLRGLTLRN